MSNCQDISGISETLHRLASESRLRSIPAGSEAVNGRIDLLSNDYLALAAHADEFRQEFAERYGDAAMSSSASRLLSRQQGPHQELEALLERLYGRPALVFNSGYHANVGLIQALAALPDTLFLSDKLIHASSIDGLRLAAAQMQRYRHNDAEHAAKILAKEADKYQHIFLLAESIYSMDGDLAPLEAFVQLKSQYPNLHIILDEAHGFGVRGERGLGLAEELGLVDAVDIIVGTLGKAAGSSGAFIVANPLTVQYLINTARSFIFSTAIPPVCCAWSVLMIEKIVRMTEARHQLAQLSEQIRLAIEQATGVDNPSRSQIIPIMCGSAERAVTMANALALAGYDVLPIRRPTVPPNGERLRLSLNSDLSLTQLTNLIDIISNYED